MKTEKEWIEQLYEVRCEPDKLLIMIMNRRQEMRNIKSGNEYDHEKALQADTEYHCFKQLEDEAIERSKWVQDNISINNQNSLSGTTRIMADYIMHPLRTK